jgi:hypothetical protein
MIVWSDSAHQLSLGPTGTNRQRRTDCRMLMVYKGVKIQPILGRNFCVRQFYIFACGSTTSCAMVKWVIQADSAGHKGPEITLEGILIVVEGCFTAQRSGSDLTKTHCHQCQLPSFYTYPANCSTNPPSISSRRETIQTVVLTDWFYSPFQLLMQPPFSLPFSARTNTTGVGLWRSHYR